MFEEDWVAYEGWGNQAGREHITLQSQLLVMTNLATGGYKAFFHVGKPEIQWPKAFWKRSIISFSVLMLVTSSQRGSQSPSWPQSLISMAVLANHSRTWESPGGLGLAAINNPPGEANMQSELKLVLWGPAWASWSLPCRVKLKLSCNFFIAPKINIEV